MNHFFSEPPGEVRGNLRENDEANPKRHVVIVAICIPSDQGEIVASQIKTCLSDYLGFSWEGQEIDYSCDQNVKQYAIVKSSFTKHIVD